MFIAASNGIARIIRAFIPLLLDLYKPFFRLLSFFLSLMLTILPPNIALSRDAAAALRAQVGDFLVSLFHEGAVGGSAGALYADFDVCAYRLCFACLLIHKNRG